MPSSRFNYVRYDRDHAELQELFKAHCMKIETLIEDSFTPTRAKMLALTKLEEAYMWIGKAVRDRQIERGGSAEHIAERGEE